MRVVFKNDYKMNQGAYRSVSKAIKERDKKITHSNLLRSDLPCRAEFREAVRNDNYAWEIDCVSVGLVNSPLVNFMSEP